MIAVFEFQQEVMNKRATGWFMSLESAMFSLRTDFLPLGTMPGFFN
jgi:hypothetical protein